MSVQQSVHDYLRHSTLFSQIPPLKSDYKLYRS